MQNHETPYVLVSIDTLRQLSAQNDLFAEKIRKVLKRSLIRAGSVPYVHQNLAVV